MCPFLLKSAAVGELEHIDLEWGTCHLIGAHPSEPEPGARGKGKVAEEHVALDVGAAHAEEGIAESIDDGIRLHVTVADTAVPVPAFLEDLPAKPETHQPCGVSPHKTAGATAVPYNPAVVHRDFLDGVPVERQIFNPVAEKRDLDGFKVVEIQFSGERKLLKRGSETEVLELVFCAEIVEGIGNDVAQGAVGVALLGKGRPCVVGVSDVIGGQRRERAGEFPLYAVEIMVACAEDELGFFVGFPVQAELSPVEPFVGTLELLGLVRTEVEVRVEHRVCPPREERDQPRECLVPDLQRAAVKPEVVVPQDFTGLEIWVVETARQNGQVPVGTRSVLVLDKAAVQPDGILGEIPALLLVGQSEALVG